MIVIGEKINATRKKIREAIRNRDAGYILQEAETQAARGAEMLDVNCGMDINREPDDMEWLVRTVQEKIDLPLVIDSPNPETLRRGIDAHRGTPFINSITGETETELGRDRIEKILPLVRQHSASLVILTIDDRGMPETSAQRLSIAEKMFRKAVDSGIPAGNIYFDLLVRPVAVEPKQASEFLDAVAAVKKNLPGVKTICGLSNVSFGLPNRSRVNSAFLVLCVNAGLDAALIDPTDMNMTAALRAADALLGKDEFCMNYVSAFKEGRF